MASGPIWSASRLNLILIVVSVIDEVVVMVDEVELGER